MKWSVTLFLSESCRQRQHGQRLAEFLVQLSVDQLDGTDLFQRHAPQSVVGEDIHDFDLDRFAIGANLMPAGFDAQQRASHDAGGGELDSLAANLIENLRQRRIGGQVDGKLAQCFGDRIFGVVGDGRDLSAAAIFEYQAFQQVVDVAGVEPQRHGRIAIDLALAIEEPHSRAEQDHSGQRNCGARSGRWVCRLLRLRGGTARCQQEEGQSQAGSAWA